MHYSPFKTIVIHFCSAHKTILTQKCLTKMFCYRVYVKGYFFIHVPDFQCGCLQNNTVVFGDNAYYNTDRLMNERGVDMCSVAVKIPDEVLYDTKMTEAVHKIISLLDIVRRLPEWWKMFLNCNLEENLLYKKEGG